MKIAIRTRVRTGSNGKLGRPAARLVKMACGREGETASALENVRDPRQIWNLATWVLVRHGRIGMLGDDAQLHAEVDND